MTNAAEDTALALLRGKAAHDATPFPQSIWGVIVSQQTGPPLTVTVKIGASTIATAGVKALTQSYAYAASDVVLLQKVGDDWLVMGKRAP